MFWGESMAKTLTQKTNRIFANNNGYARTRDLTAAGLHSSQIKRLENEGQIIKLKRGLYKAAEYPMGDGEELVDVSKIVPNGVICLLSALAFHELTTYQPWEHYVAIHRDAAKPTLPYYPPIRIAYFSEAQYSIGTIGIDIHGHQVKIYDAEKTLCDCARYQNKLGKDVVKESFRSYFNRPGKDVDKLMEYAKKTRVQSIVAQYAEILL